MVTTPKNATVSTRIESSCDGFRVVYDTPPEGFTADEQDALTIALLVAERHIAELASPLDPLTVQHDRMAAPC